MLDQEKHKGSISQRNRLAFAYMELASDRNFLKLPEEKKLELIQKVLALGDDVALWAQTECQSHDPRKIAEHFGIKIFGEDKGISVNKIRRSEYRSGSNEIIIFRDTLSRLMGEVASKELSDHLLRFFVAFELFRHLEKIKIGNVSEKFKITAWRFLGWERKKTIKKIGSVAAHAFCQSLLQLDFSPLVFDYLAYILYADLRQNAR